jgi:hypothetical protein
MSRPATEAAAYTTLTVRLPPALLDVLRDHASTYHMSLNAEILSAVEDRVAAIEKARRARETGKGRRSVLTTV